MQTKNRTNPVDFSIGKAVEAQRQQARQSIHDVAEQLNISVQTYTELEAGHMPFQAHDLFALANMFGVPARDLMPQDAALMEIRAAERYADAEEVRDLIYFFSGIVSPALRTFFLAEIQNASVQRPPEPAPAPTMAPAKPAKIRQRLSLFRPHRTRQHASI